MASPKTLILSMIAAITVARAGAQSAAQPAAQYTPIDQGSTISFAIKNFGFMTGGHFTGLQGKILFQPDRLPEAVFDVSIDAASINTDNDMRDSHLKNEDYFDVLNHPTIKFMSTRIMQGAKGGFIVSGKLTIKNQTRDISFPFVATPIGNDYIFKGEFPLNRRDFDIGGSSTISNNLTVSLTVYAKKG
jgi:polyisoprenoid-binding protein YceI